MKIQSGHLKLFIEVLNGTNPRFIEARLRNRILKDLYEYYIPFEKERTELCLSLCKKDTEGNAIKEEGHYTFEDKEREILEEKYKEIAEKKNSLSLTGDEPFRIVALIESTNYVPLEGETEIIDDCFIDALLGKKNPKEKKVVKKESKNNSTESDKTS